MNQSPRQFEDIPLCVDLDGTFFQSDTSWEMLNAFLLKHPLKFYLAIWWFIQGIHILKSKLADYARINMDLCPINEAVLELISKEKGRRHIYLVSGSSQKLLKKSEILKKTFDGCSGSNDAYSQTGKIKAEYLVHKYGDKGFDYVGGSLCDRHVWVHARVSYTTKKQHIGWAQKHGLEMHLIRQDKKQIFLRLSFLRPYQWIKNILCFIPVITAHKWLEIEAWELSFVALLVLSLSSSLIYIINDLYDIDSDRMHPIKKKRAIASGKIGIQQAWIAILLLAVILIPLLLNIDRSASAMVVLQIVASLAYTFYFKRKPIVDVVVLGCLYSNRVIIGCFAIGVLPTEWLIGFALFFFIGIACVKRFAEAFSHNVIDKPNLPGRDYMSNDSFFMLIMGYVSSAMSNLVLALYIAQLKTAANYPSHEFLWGLCIIHFYWISHLWLLANRGNIHDDPLKYLVRDKKSYFCAFLSMLFIILAST